MRVELTDQTKGDLGGIGEHYAEFGGKTLAHRVVSGIKTEVLALADNPNIGTTYDLAPGLRRLGSCSPRRTRTISSGLRPRWSFGGLRESP